MAVKDCAFATIGETDPRIVVWPGASGAKETSTSKKKREMARTEVKYLMMNQQVELVYL
jgi:hypothetical protein